MSKFGMFWCLVAGAGFAAFVLGFPIAFSGEGSGGAFIAVGINVWWLTALLGYGLLAGRAGRIERRRLTGTEVRRTALAKIETSHATGNSETPTVSIRMELTIAADGAPAFRAGARAGVNLVDAAAYRAGNLLVVTYDETRPWRVTVVTNPTPEWAQRAAHGAVDSAPRETLVQEPRATLVERRRWARAGTASMSVGFVLGLVFFAATHGWS